MAQTLEILMRRTGTMQSIRSIVRTMKTMSAINALPYEQAAQSIDAYRDTALMGLHAFVVKNGPLPHDDGPDALPVIIAFGSDHGLCGNYNEVVAGGVRRIFTPASRIIAVGVQMEDALSGQGISPKQTLMPPATTEGLGRLAGRLITLLDDIRLADARGSIAVSLVFMQRAAHGEQHPVTQRLLPLDPAMTEALAKRRWSSRSLPTFSLPPERLFAALIHSFLFAEMFRAAAEALVTENAARLARMQQAEQSIDDRLEQLNAETRSVRQSEITTELMDVIIGFEAMKDRDRLKSARQRTGKGAGTASTDP